MPRSTKQARLRDAHGYYAAVKRTADGRYRAVNADRGYATDSYSSIDALSTALIFSAIYDYPISDVDWSDNQRIDQSEYAGISESDVEVYGPGETPSSDFSPSYDSGSSYDSSGSSYDSSGSSYDSGGSSYSSSGSSYDSGGSSFDSGGGGGGGE